MIFDDLNVHLDRLLTQETFLKNLNRRQDVLSANVKMRDRAQRGFSKRRHQNSRAGQLLGGPGRIQAQPANVHDDDVGLHAVKIDLHAFHLVKMFRQEPGVGMILRQPLEMVIQRMNAGGGQNAGLAHATTKHFSQASRLRHKLYRSRHHRAHRRPQTF